MEWGNTKMTKAHTQFIIRISAGADMVADGQSYFRNVSIRWKTSALGNNLSSLSPPPPHTHKRRCNLISPSVKHQTVYIQSRLAHFVLLYIKMSGRQYMGLGSSTIKSVYVSRLYCCAVRVCVTWRSN